MATYFDRKSIPLNEIYKEDLQNDKFAIKRFELTESEVSYELMRNYRNLWLVRGLKPNYTYVKLQDRFNVWMSDTPMEINSNYDFIRRANGDVLIFGLGLGMIILPLLNDKAIKSIKVVEIDAELINLVLPVIKLYDKRNILQVINADAHEFHKMENPSVKYDSIYGDIWESIHGDNYVEMKKLTAKWKNRLNRQNPDAFIEHWLKQQMRKMYKYEN